MRRFSLKVADADSGEEVRLTVEAATKGEACRKASARGFLVAGAIDRGLAQPPAVAWILQALFLTVVLGTIASVISSVISESTDVVALYLLVFACVCLAHPRN